MLDNSPSFRNHQLLFYEQLLVSDWRICFKPFGAILCLVNVVTKCFATWDASPWVHMSKTIKIIGRLLRGRLWDYSKGSIPYSGLCEDCTHMWGLHTQAMLSYSYTQLRPIRLCLRLPFFPLLNLLQGGFCSQWYPSTISDLLVTKSTFYVVLSLDSLLPQVESTNHITWAIEMSPSCVQRQQHLLWSHVGATSITTGLGGGVLVVLLALSPNIIPF